MVIDFPISTEELLKIKEAVRSIDFEYCEGLQIEDIKPEDIDKIAIFYNIIQELTDVPQSRIEYLIDNGLELPDYDTLCDKYDI